LAAIHVKDLAHHESRVFQAQDGLYGIGNRPPRQAANDRL